MDPSVAHEPIWPQPSSLLKQRMWKCSGWAVAWWLLWDTLGSMLMCIYADMVNTHDAFIATVHSLQIQMGQSGYLKKAFLLVEQAGCHTHLSVFFIVILISHTYRLMYPEN